jgi:hypothetical protein
MRRRLSVAQTDDPFAPLLTVLLGLFVQGDVSDWGSQWGSSHQALHFFTRSRQGAKLRTSALRNNNAESRSPRALRRG